MDRTSVSTDFHRVGDELARRARVALQGRYGLLSIFDERHQHILGIDGPAQVVHLDRDVPLMESFCNWVMDSGSQLIIDDVRAETRINAHPMLAALGVQSYAGWHVVDEDGRAIGVLCTMDDRPRAWSSAELTALMELAHEYGPMVQAAVALRRTPNEAA